MQICSFQEPSIVCIAPLDKAKNMGCNPCLTTLQIFYMYLHEFIVRFLRKHTRF